MRERDRDIERERERKNLHLHTLLVLREGGGQRGKQTEKLGKERETNSDKQTLASKRSKASSEL